MTGELTLARAWWRVAGSALLPAVTGGLVVGYAAWLGARGTRLGLLVGLFVVLAGWAVVVALLTVVAQSSGAAVGVVTGGVRVRVHAWQRRVVTVPWGEITLLWIGHTDGRRFLGFTADPRGASADQWDPGHKRFTRRFKPFSVYVPKSVSDQQLAAAVAGCSAGTVTVADRGPEEERGAGRRSAPPAVRWALTGVALVVGLPGLLGVAPPWNQPWWPGVTGVGALPDPCVVFGGAHAGGLGATDPQVMQDDMLLRRCDYTVPQGDLSVRLELHSSFFGSSTEDAHASVEDLAGSLGGTAESVADVGDEAWLVGNPQGTTTLIDRGVVRLVARRANVVLLILYGGEVEPDAARPAVLSAARDALDGLPVG